jgi:hypothetical protein
MFGNVLKTLIAQSVIKHRMLMIGADSGTSIIIDSISKHSDHGREIKQ